MDIALRGPQGTQRKTPERDLGGTDDVALQAAMATEPDELRWMAVRPVGSRAQ